MNTRIPCGCVWVLPHSLCCNIYISYYTVYKIRFYSELFTVKKPGSATGQISSHSCELIYKVQLWWLHLEPDFSEYCVSRCSILCRVRVIQASITGENRNVTYAVFKKGLRNSLKLTLCFCLGLHARYPMAMGTLADLEDQEPIPGKESPLKIHLKVRHQPVSQVT